MYSYVRLYFLINVKLCKKSAVFLCKRVAALHNGEIPDNITAVRPRRSSYHDNKNLKILNGPPSTQQTQ